MTNSNETIDNQSEKLDIQNLEMEEPETQQLISNQPVFANCKFLEVRRMLQGISIPALGELRTLSGLK